jgi:hypothetical protein
VGCTGAPADSHDTLWFWVKGEKQSRCPECGSGEFSIQQLYDIKHLNFSPVYKLDPLQAQVVEPTTA